jgi:hypothetical protein
MLVYISGCATKANVKASASEFLNGVDNGRGACIGQNYAVETCSFAISLIDDKNLAPIILLSQESSGHDPAGSPLWKIKDTLPVPQATKGIHLEYISCRYDKKSDDTVVALVTDYDAKDSDWIRAVDWAYRIDLPSGKFLKIDSEKVDCANTAIGAD